MDIGVLTLDSTNTGRRWIPLIERVPTDQECQFVDNSFWTVALRESGLGAILSMRTYVRGYWVRIDKNNGEIVSDDSFHYWLLEEMYAFPEPPRTPPVGDNRDLSRRGSVPLSRVSRGMNHYGDRRYDINRSVNRRQETYEWANHFIRSNEDYQRRLRELSQEMARYPENLTIRHENRRSSP
jgi:hypothetical protein